MEIVIIILLIISNIYFAFLWFAASKQLEGAFCYMVDKGYELPSKEILMEYVRICIREGFKIF